MEMVETCEPRELCFSERAGRVLRELGLSPKRADFGGRVARLSYRDLLMVPKCGLFTIIEIQVELRKAGVALREPYTGQPRKSKRCPHCGKVIYDAPRFR